MIASRVFVDTDLAADDYEALSRRVRRRAARGGPGARRPWVRPVAAVVAILFFAALVPRVPWLAPTLRLDAPTVLFVAALILFLSLSLGPMLRARTMPQPGGLLLGPHRVEIADEGLVAEGRLGRSLTRWAAVRTIEETPRHLFVYVDRATAFVIPTRSFPSPAAASEFLAALRARVPDVEFGVAPESGNFAGDQRRRVLLLLVVLFAALVWPELRFWGERVPVGDEATEDRSDDEAYEQGEELVYRQADLLADELESLRPQRRGVVDLYFVGFAGEASQDVFMREVAYARGLFDRRFDTAGRSLVLINNRSTKDRFPLASLASLEIALRRLGEVLDREEDVLVLFLTSHGSEDHVLTVDYYPMPFVGIAPGDLARALTASGIRWRVVIVSACYSGAFLEPLADDHTLVVTASAKNRQSFGCGQGDELTYFGRAFLKEGLEKHLSIVEAFQATAASIADREKREKLTASRPQLHSPQPILDKLHAVEARIRGREKAAQPR